MKISQRAADGGNAADRHGVNGLPRANCQRVCGRTFLEDRRVGETESETSLQKGAYDGMR